MNMDKAEAKSMDNKTDKENAPIKKFVIPLMQEPMDNKDNTAKETAIKKLETL